jgi:hypothetical protein
MRITPHAELEAYARQQYRKYAKRLALAAARSVPLNVEAVTLLNKPRELPYGKVSYRAPPLTFRQGFDLMVAANALRARRIANQPTDEARSIAVRLIRPVFFPKSRVLRLLLPARWMNVPDIGIETIIYALLFLPDDGAVAPPSKPIRSDLMDAVATFAQQLPAWCVPEWRYWFFGWRKNRDAGLPLSWAHYVYGMSHIARKLARDDLRAATAARRAWADKQAWKTFESEQRSAAGWVH